MKKITLFLGVIAIVALTGFLVMACNSDGGGGGADGDSTINGWQGGKKPAGGGGSSGPGNQIPPAPSGPFTVTFDDGDSTTAIAPASLQVTASPWTLAYSLVTTKPDASIGGGNKLLLGWKIMAGQAAAAGDLPFVFAGAPFGGTPTVVQADITVYPVYADKITITFDANTANGGTGSPSPASVDIPTGGVIPATTVITGVSASDPSKALLGWYTAATGGAKVVFGSDTFDAAATLYAHYGDAWTVTFNLNGASGTVPTAQKIDKSLPDADRIATAPADPLDLPAGYTLVSWHSATPITTGNVYNFSTKVDEDITLYALLTTTVTLKNSDVTTSIPNQKWGAAIDFGTPPVDADGATAHSDGLYWQQTKADGDPGDFLDTTDNTFAVWATATTLGNAHGNLTLYARWTYKVTFSPVTSWTADNPVAAVVDVDKGGDLDIADIPSTLETNNSPETITKYYEEADKTTEITKAAIVTACTALDEDKEYFVDNT